MDFFDVINQRFSYRGEFKNQPVPKEDLDKILDAAIKAPSGLNKQTTYFVAVTDPAVRTKVAEIFPHKGIASAPAIIIIVSEHAEVYQGKAFEVQDYSVAVENILLAVTALDYATVWTEGETAANGRPEALAKLLDVPSNLTVRSVLAIGVPVTVGKPAQKKKLEERVRFI